ncbi:helix-turn-helix domain-containing protein [Clostridium sp. MCC353]|uniref:AraC family transcriptional regulator n=1 Tax=Clostridium sp. MCC353 TaxID=2592646 RepID=UPI001C015F43|nr:AraC family transcriptional regulator [Clostridium sp. MCC353]MBT9776397.1 helix-turn-helix domain-containing protein [Clostridium sp. MCC353]
MKKELLKYSAILEDDFSIKYKSDIISSKKPFHIHSQFEIVFSLTDELICELENQTLVVPPGCFLLLNHMDLHCLRTSENQPCFRYVLFFSPEYLSGFSSDADLQECFIYRGVNTPHLLPLASDEQKKEAAAYLEELLHYQTADPGTVYGCELSKKLLLAQLLLFINRRYREYHGILLAGSENHKTFYRIISYISSNYAKELTVDSLCRRFLLSKTALYHLFHETCRESPGEYIIRYRLEKSKEFLHQNHTVEEAAFLSGYSNQAHFSRIFKQRTGLTPKQYQKLHRL